jgi:hypothetical protein
VYHKARREGGEEDKEGQEILDPGHQVFPSDGFKGPGKAFEAKAKGTLTWLSGLKKTVITKNQLLAVTTEKFRGWDAG